VRNYRTIQKAFNERKKLPSQIIVNKEPDNYNISEEYHEYEYFSLQFHTNFNIYYANPILDCHFSYKIIIDDGTREDLERFKDSLEGYTTFSLGK